MNREELRRDLLSACDRALAHPAIVGAKTVRILKAMQELARTDDAFLDKLNGVLDRMPRGEEDAYECLDT